MTSSSLRLMRLAPSANARSLAVLRIATCLAALPTARAWAGSDWELLPRELWFPPFGTRWAVDVVPISPTLLKAASLLFLFSVILVMVGYRARLFAAVSVVAGLYAGWVPHLVGKVDHNHHIIWFLALLALSPCNDALSIRRDQSERSPRAYALPALAGVMVLGVIYLSSVLPKIGTGLDWALSDNIRNLMWNQWWEKQYVPPIRVDQWPIVYKSMGVATIAFETLFLPAALYPPTRRWIRWIGLGFHFLIWVFLTINFWTLAILYVVLFDWGGTGSQREIEDPGGISVAPLALVLVIAIGALTIPAGWPLSGYPGFAGITSPVYVDYEFVTSAGETRLVTRSGLASRYGPQAARPMTVIALYRGNEEALLRHVSEVEGHSPDYYVEIRPIEVSTVPSHRNE